MGIDEAGFVCYNFCIKEIKNISSTKQQVLARELNKKIKRTEQTIFNLEKQIKQEKFSLGSIIANNREAAPMLAKACKLVSGIARQIKNFAPARSSRKSITKNPN